MVNFEEEKAITIDLSNEEPIQTEVYDINHLPSYKIAEEERRANEKERIANENERKDYYNDFTTKVNEGYFDGANGVYVGSEQPTDEDVNVWIDPNGTPEVEAKNIVFLDNETLQTKYDNGELKGEKGDKGADGTMSFNDLTEEQKTSLKGDKGENGQDGYTPVKGVDYFTNEDIASLNIPTKTSDLTNDSNFVKNNEVYVKGDFLILRDTVTLNSTITSVSKNLYYGDTGFNTTNSRVVSYNFKKLGSDTTKYYAHYGTELSDGDTLIKSNIFVKPSANIFETDRINCSIYYGYATEDTTFEIEVILLKIS